MNIIRLVDANDAVEVLNRVHAADPSVMPALIFHRVPCNRAVADDPTVQVGTSGGRYSKSDEPAFEVGLLGILNGIFGVRDNGVGYIAANYDEDGTLTEFAVLGDAS